jgi:hypothetical protein
MEAIKIVDLVLNKSNLIWTRTPVDLPYIILRETQALGQILERVCIGCIKSFE